MKGKSFAEKNLDKYRPFLNQFIAERILLSWINWLFLIVFGLVSFLNYRKYGLLAGLVYAPAITFWSVYRLGYELSLFGKKEARFLLDCITYSFVLGFNLLLLNISLMHKSNELTGNGSLGFILSLCLGLTFTTRRIVLLGKLIILCVVEWLVLDLIDPKLLKLYQMELIFGGGFGLLVSYLLNQVIMLDFERTVIGSASLLHAYTQLQKLVFPHQLELMKTGSSLEETMPTASGEAVALCFDLQESSTLSQHVLNEFMQRLMQRVDDIIMQDYQKNPLCINAFKVKEMGDGFLCTVGFPLAAPEGQSIFDLALQLSFRFIDETDRICEEMNLNDLYCSMGIASGTVHSFFAKAGIRNFDCFGRPLIWATRYEHFRKVLRRETSQSFGHCIALQTETWAKSSADTRQSFKKIVLEKNLTIRDDPDAQSLYIYTTARRELDRRHEAA